MGSQQLLLLVLGTIVVAIAIAVGITEFRSYHTEAIGDEMQSTLQTLAVEAKAHFLKPKTLGGGGMSFDGFHLPKNINDGSDVVYDMSTNTITGQVALILKARGKDGLILAIVGKRTGSDSFEITWNGMGAYTSRMRPIQPL